jgi:hypothetical protein
MMSSKNFNEDQAISLTLIVAGFGNTQVVRGNWSIHASPVER